MPKKTVGFCSTIATMLIWGGAVFAAGYTCPTYKKYTSCSSGYYLNGTNAGNSCTACPDKYTGSDNGRTSIHDCYTYDTALVTCKPANAYSGTGWDYYDNNDNGGTGHDRCLYTVKKCNSGYYLTNNTCAQCPTDYPITDPRNNPYSDETSIEECWRDCGVSDIPHATAVSGWREYGGRNTCVATSCENGYYLNNGTCTQCTGATYCTNSIKYECPSEFDANTDPGKTAASQCQIMVNPGYAVERGAYTQTPCDPNYYCPGGLVAYGAHGVWSHCPENYSSPRGSSKLSDCYKTCTQENENNGTLVPDDTTVYYPDDCTYKRVCNDGYAPTNNSCMALCRSGITQIRLGNTPTPTPLFDERQTTPTVVIRTPSGGLCYGNLSKGNGKTNTINLNIMGTTYHMPIE